MPQATETDSAPRRCPPWSGLEKLQLGEYVPGLGSRHAAGALVSLNAPCSWPKTLCLNSCALESSLGRTEHEMRQATRTEISGVAETSQQSCHCHRTEGGCLAQEILHASVDQGPETFHDEGEKANRAVPHGVFELQADAGDEAAPRSELVLPPRGRLGLFVDPPAPAAVV